MDNIRGVFYIEFSGKRKELKASIGLSERLEQQIYKRPLIRVLKEACAGEPFISDIYRLYHEAIIEGGDRRMNFEQVGEEILKLGGAPAVMQQYTDILSYMLTAGVQGDSSEDKKK